MSWYHQRRCREIMRSQRAARDEFGVPLCLASGHSCCARPGYVIDHIQALKHGGSDTPDNMQWQSTADAKAKDRAE